MDRFFLGLWAAGLLARQQHERLRHLDPCAQDAICTLWRDEKFRPAKWSHCGSLDELLARAEQGYEQLERTIARTERPIRVIPANVIGIRTRSPFVTLVGESPPTTGALGIVGTRGISKSEAEQLERWLRPLIRQCHAVVSGGAYGVDTVAHRVSIDCNMPTWVVFASGLDHTSPKGNQDLFDKCLAQGGGWISEKVPWYKPFASDFLERNDLIASLSNALLVARAPSRSGALSTARFAQAQGKPVMAFPGNPDDENAEGCHQLLEGGALWAGPHTRLAKWLNTEEQSSLTLSSDVAEERMRPIRPTWTNDEEAALCAFATWKNDDAEGWMFNDAGAHQEQLLDLELGGWIERAPNGEPIWTEQGKIAATWILSKTKETKV